MKKKWDTHNAMIKDSVLDKRPLGKFSNDEKRQQLKIIQFNLYKTIQLINTFLEENKDDGGVNTE
tara:strand:- start:823 stop:1017 length:195 start_codon:yes stop_codon:yes gene_type:complete